MMIEIDNILDVEQHLFDIKVAVFDLDDTLYSERDYVKSGYKAIAKEFPQIPDMANKLWLFFEKGLQAIDEELKYEGIYSEDTKAKCLKIYRNHIPNIRLYAGVKKMLLRILKRGLKLGMITDGRPDRQYAKIEALKISDIFNKIIVTDELGGVEYRKPNPKSFIMMKEYFGVDSKNIVYVGDNISKDFVALEGIGMKGIHFKNRLGLYN